VKVRSTGMTARVGSSAGWICTTDLQIMSLASFYFSTAQSGLLDLNQHFPGYEPGVISIFTKSRSIHTRPLSQAPCQVCGVYAPIPTVTEPVGFREEFVGRELAKSVAGCINP
jgi:hypothetical protein